MSGHQLFGDNYGTVLSGTKFGRVFFRRFFQNRRIMRQEINAGNFF
jgi:hypothetical protein